jgi:hypothetical protein
MAEVLRPCPFCGAEAEFERMGTPRYSTIVRCTDCGATHECGEEWGHGGMWNTRVYAWTRTADATPTTEPGAQANVIFCSPGWGWPIVGMYTHWPEDSGLDRWAMYDQVNDRYVDWGKPSPELWMPFPEVPKEGKK